MASTPAVPRDPNSKTGTSVVKSAPPKETARITVKPNLPTVAPRAGGGNLPGVGAGAAPAAKPVAATKPATTIVKTGVQPARAAVVKPAVTAAPAVAAAPAPFQEEASTTLTTVLAALLALLTWGTAGVLIASYYQLI